MQKVLLMIDCDWCRCVYEHIRLTSNDVTAWDHHGNALVDEACEQEGWAISECGNYHYCPNCADEVEKFCFEFFETQRIRAAEMPDIDF